MWKKIERKGRRKLSLYLDDMLVDPIERISPNIVLKEAEDAINHWIAG